MLSQLVLNDIIDSNAVNRTYIVVHITVIQTACAMFVVQSKGLLLLFSLVVLSIAANNDSINHREEKLFGSAGMFTVARFANTECERDFHKGTCYTNWECHTGVNGPFNLFDTSTSSKCQSGFGMCCITLLGCGATSNNNNTYLRSPGYNGNFNYGLDCTQSIKIDSSICQLRMDIIDLELAYPTSAGFCNDDYLKVSQDTKFEYVCGVTKNTHFYLDVDASKSTVVNFQFHTSTDTSVYRRWNIRVQKIMCNTDAEVMRGCGQYYMGTSGTLRGFNMDGSTSYNYLIHNLNYAVCVRMELGYCSTTYVESRNAWLPRCSDIFQRPGDLSASSAPQTQKCGDSSTLLSEYTISFLAPHIFWLDSRDSSNTHYSKDDSVNNYGSYDINYEQSNSGC